MNIGINSRIYQSESTGIPNFIKYLYSTIEKIDHKNNYFFFQTDLKKKIGQTYTCKTFNNIVGNFLFDNFQINKLIKKYNIAVFHGTSNLIPFYKVPNVKYV
ncbi:MAG: hypothetical protein V1872_00145, partial [bacterium]